MCAASMCLCIPMLVVISCSVLKWMPLVFHTAIVLPFFRRISYILFILLFVGETFESDSDGFPLFYFEIFIIQIAVFLLFLVTCKLCSTFFFCTFRLCSKELLSRFFLTLLKLESCFLWLFLECCVPEYIVHRHCMKH